MPVQLLPGVLVPPATNPTTSPFIVATKKVSGYQVRVLARISLLQGSAKETASISVIAWMSPGRARRMMTSSPMCRYRLVLLE